MAVPLPSLRTPIFAPLLAVPAEPLLAAIRTGSPPVAAGHDQKLYGVWPRIRLMPRTDSSDFARNPAAGLSSISSL